MNEHFEIGSEEQADNLEISMPEDKQQLKSEAIRTEYVDYTQRQADYHNRYEMSRTEKALNKIRGMLGLPTQNEETQATIAHRDALVEKPFRDELLRKKQEEAEKSRKDRAA